MLTTWRSRSDVRTLHPRTSSLREFRPAESRHQDAVRRSLLHRMILTRAGRRTGESKLRFTRAPNIANRSRTRAGNRSSYQLTATRYQQHPVARRGAFAFAIWRTAGTRRSYSDGANENCSMVGSRGWRGSRTNAFRNRMAESDVSPGCAASATGGCSRLPPGTNRGRTRGGDAGAGGVSLQSNGCTSWRDGRDTFRFISGMCSADDAAARARSTDDAAAGELRAPDLGENGEGVLFRESDSRWKAFCNCGRTIDGHRRKALRARNRNVHRHPARRQIGALASIATS